MHYRNNHDELKELELLLITTAEYYDSAFKSKDRPEYDWEFFAIWSICLLPTKGFW